MSEKIRNKTSKRQKNSRQTECEPVHRSGPDRALAHQHGGRLGVKVTVLGRGQVRGGLLHGLYPGIVVAHQNALKGLLKHRVLGPPTKY